VNADAFKVGDRVTMRQVGMVNGVGTRPVEAAACCNDGAAAASAAA
jgi:hypothetical protein